VDSFIPHCSLLSLVLQVLQQLPEGLAMSVLANAPMDLEHQLAMLPASLHPLAIKAAYTSSVNNHSLTLNLGLDSYGGVSSTTACEVLHFATFANTGLQKLVLRDIPMLSNESLFQMISAACLSASDVSLGFGCNQVQNVHTWQPITQLGEVLPGNTALTSLQLTFCADPDHVFNYDCLVEGLTGLRSLSIAFHMQKACGSPTPARSVPAGITKLLHLTCLQLGPGFHLMDVPQIVLHLSGLHSLHLRGGHYLQERPVLDSLTQLQSLTFDCCYMLKALPPLAALTALQTLDVADCSGLPKLPPLDTLTALKTMKLSCCDDLRLLPSFTSLEQLQTLAVGRTYKLRKLPPLDSLTALQVLELFMCLELRQLPSLDSLNALQTLMLTSCYTLQQLPCLDSLTALQTLQVNHCQVLRQLPPLNRLTALQTLHLTEFSQLLELPDLKRLTALQTLNLRECTQLQHVPPLDTVAGLQRLNLQQCRELKQLPPLDTLTALQTLDLNSCRQLQQLPSLDKLTSLLAIDVSHCLQLQQLPCMSTLTALQHLVLWDCEKLSQGCLRLPSSPGPGVLVHGVSQDELRVLQGEQYESGHHESHPGGFPRLIHLHILADGQETMIPWKICNFWFRLF
jgi:hypothetical protein